jgi:hypothetical protein
LLNTLFRFVSQSLTFDQILTGKWRHIVHTLRRLARQFNTAHVLKTAQSDGERNYTWF